MGTGHPKHLYGLAPGGVYLAADITTGAGGLLHHRFTLAQQMVSHMSRNTLLCGTCRQVALPGR